MINIKNKYNSSFSYYREPSYNDRTKQVQNSYISFDIYITEQNFVEKIFINFDEFKNTNMKLCEYQIYKYKKTFKTHKESIASYLSEILNN